MNVLIAGANGQIGQRLVRKLQESNDHKAIALVRKEEQAEQFENEGVQTRLVDLEDSINKIAAAAEGVDAVVFTAGSGASTGADKTITIDLDGAIKTMKAAKQAGVNRFVIISAIGVHQWHTDNHHEWMDRAPHYSASKFYADAWLERSGLDYTIIRPGGLTNTTGTGKVKIGDNLEFDNVSREDVADVIINVLENEEAIGCSFDLTGGNTQIEQAIKSLPL